MTEPKSDSQGWYIVKTATGHCEITQHELTPESDSTPERNTSWGPFDDQQTAIAKRVGLIRSGKCLPR